MIRRINRAPLAPGRMVGFNAGIRGRGANRRDGSGPLGNTPLCPVNRRK